MPQALQAIITDRALPEGDELYKKKVQQALQVIEVMNDPDQSVRISPKEFARLRDYLTDSNKFKETMLVSFIVGE